MVFELHALGFFVPNHGFHFDQVNNALEAVFSTDWDDDWNRVGFEAQTHLLNNFEEVGACAVHFVYEGQTWHFVLVSLTPNGFRLGLHATYSTVDHASAVKYAHGTLNFNGEVNVSGGVDDVDAVLWTA